jgi:CheY-like chemotaxis protein
LLTLPSLRTGLFDLFGLTSAVPDSVFDWVIRAVFGLLAVVIARACWRRRNAREIRQEELEAARLASRTHQLALEKQRAEEGNRIKAQFLSGIGQDIRVPLNDILNSLELVLITSLTAEQRNLIERSKGSARELLTQLASVLDISTVEAERLRINSVEFSVRDWFRSMVTALSPSARDAGVDLQVNIGADLPNQLVGDPDLLRRVFRALIKESIKVTTSHQVNIVMRLDRRSTRRNIGSVQVLPLFFAVETRTCEESLDLRDENDDEVTLPFCERLLGLMGGRVWSQSDGGRRKVCCTVRLEAPRSNSNQPCSTPDTVKPEFRALLIESNRANQLALLPTLEKQGLHCLVANDAGEALTLIDRFTCDLIVIGARTSASDQLEPVRLIRAREKSTGSNAPILVLMAHATRGDRQACLQAGADMCLDNSAARNQLRDSIDTLLQPRQSPQASA